MQCRKERARSEFPIDISPFERQLTIEEAEGLAEGQSFELIEGRMVFKMASKIHSKIQEKGSRVVWIVFPSEQSVLVMTQNERRWITDRLACPEVLPDFALNVPEIFSWPKK